MTNKVEDTDIKNCTYNFFNDINDTKNLDSNNITIDEKSFKNIFTYYIGQVTIKDLVYLKINSVNPLYLILNKVNGYFNDK